MESQLTLKKMLLGGFVFVVLLTGIICLIMGNSIKVTADKTTDLLQKEKAPIQQAANKSACALFKILKDVEGLSSEFENISNVENSINSVFDEFYMWINLIAYGSDSQEFMNGQYYQIFQDKKLAPVYQGSQNVLKIAKEILDKKNAYLNILSSFIANHKKIAQYSLNSEGHFYQLNIFIPSVQVYFNEWMSAIQDAINMIVVYEEGLDFRKNLLSQLIFKKYSDPKITKINKKMLKAFNKLIKTLNDVNLANTYEEKQKIFDKSTRSQSKVIRGLVKLKVFVDRIFKKLNSQQIQAKRDLSVMTKEITSLLDQLIDEVDDEMKQAIVTSKKDSNRAFMLFIVVICIAIAISTILGGIVSKRIINIIGRVNVFSDKLSKGNLTGQIEIKTKDEFGELAKGLNDFSSQIRNIVKDISGRAEGISLTSAKLDASSDQILQETEGISGKSNAVACATEQASSAITNIANFSENITNMVDGVVNSIGEMNSSLSEVSKKCIEESTIASKAEQQANKTKELMNKLGDSARSIGKVLDVVNDIADKTNLLALNATIEAASAGDAGKGFAVVANEVKELAKQTANAIGQITTQVEGIQSDTKSSMSAMENISDVIVEVNNISQTIVAAVEEQSATIGEISSSVTNVKTSVDESNSNVSETAQGLNEISSNILEVNNAVKEMLNNVQSLKRRMKELVDTAEALENIVKKFTI